MDILELDHIEGDGWEDREYFKRNEMSIWSYYFEYLEEAALKLQVLCVDCHRKKTIENHDAWRRRPQDSKLNLEGIQN
jgi:hypothetical protein